MEKFLDLDFKVNPNALFSFLSENEACTFNRDFNKVIRSLKRDGLNLNDSASALNVISSQQPKQHKQGRDLSNALGLMRATE